MTIDVIEKSRKRFNISTYQANHTMYKTKDHTKRGLMESVLKTGRTNNFFRKVPLHISMETLPGTVQGLIWL